MIVSMEDGEDGEPKFIQWMHGALGNSNNR